jgi:hypothetical protein
MGAQPHPRPRAFVGHYQLYLFPWSDICFLHVSPGVGNFLETKKANIYRLFRYLTVLVVRSPIVAIG